MAPLPTNRAIVRWRACALALSATAALVLVACGGGGTTSEQTNGAPAAANSTGLRPLPSEFSSRRAVAYSPYRTAATVDDRANEVITDAQVKQDLDLLVTAGIGLIRLFDSTDKVALRTLRVIQENKLDIKVMLGIYVNSFEMITDATKRASVIAANEDEIARGVKLAKTYKDQVVAVSVGNETLVSWSFVPISSTTMAGYIKTVRDQVDQPVTTDDNYAVYAGVGRNAAEQVAEVLRQIDFASIHTYAMLDVEYSNFNDSVTLPDWDWQQEAVANNKRAEAMMNAALAKTQKDYAMVRSFLDKNGRSAMPIIIGETGWKAAVPSDKWFYRYLAHPVNQKMYVSRLLDWALASKQDNGPKGIVYFEAFDEPWKQADDKWGLFNVKREARCSAQALNPTATWAKETGSCADSAALYYSPPVPNAPVTNPTLTIFNETVTGVPEGMRVDAYENGGTFTRTYPKKGDSADSDKGTSLETSNYLLLDTFVPKNYGWGLLWQSNATPAATANMSNFAGGSVRFSVNTQYAGKLRIGLSSDTMTGVGAEAFVFVENGDKYGYCNKAGTWCDVKIPVADFIAANPKLDLRLVLTRFSISDVYEQTGNKAGDERAIKLDNIYWTQSQ